jgi:lysophospholipase L1-like esterase
MKAWVSIAISLILTGVFSAASWQAMRWRVTELQRRDYALREFYAGENARLGPPKTGERRVVFFGDSLVKNWSMAESFPSRVTVNRGIPGQTTEHLLLRFEQDVVALKPETVVILAGTNDLAERALKVSIQPVLDDYAAMAEIARANGIKVIFFPILPVRYLPSNPISRREPKHIEAVNTWLREFTRARGHGFVDCYSALAAGDGYLRPELSTDGLHLNAAGYRILAEKLQPLLQDGDGLLGMIHD